MLLNNTEKKNIDGVVSASRLQEMLLIVKKSLLIYLIVTKLRLTYMIQKT